MSEHETPVLWFMFPRTQIRGQVFCIPQIFGITKQTLGFHWLLACHNSSKSSFQGLDKSYLKLGLSCTRQIQNMDFGVRQTFLTSTLLPLNWKPFSRAIYHICQQGEAMSYGVLLLLDLCICMKTLIWDLGAFCSVGAWWDISMVSAWWGEAPPNVKRKMGHTFMF